MWNAETGKLLRTLNSDYREDSIVAFKPDGSLIGCGGRAGVRLWDAETGKLQLEAAGHQDAITSLVFSPDGSVFATGGHDGTVALWDAETGDHLRTVDEHTDRVHCVAFSPDSNTLASGSFDETVRLWNPETGELKQVLNRRSHEVYSLAFTRDGNVLASGDLGWVRLWDVKTGEHLHTLSRYRGTIRSMAFSPGGATLAIGDLDLCFLTQEAGEWKHQRNLAGHIDLINSIAFSADGKTLFTASGDGTVLIWRHEAAPPASSSTVSVTPSWVTSPALGRELSLSLDIESKESVAGYQATVSFDSAGLRYIDSAVESYLPSRAFVLPPVVDQNRVTLGALALNGEGRGDGTLATLRFEVLAVKASSVKLLNVSLVDQNANRTYPLLEDGRVVEPPPPVRDVDGDGVVDIRDVAKVSAALEDSRATLSEQFAALSSLDASDVAGRLWRTTGLDGADAAIQRGGRFLHRTLAVLTPKETTLLPNYPDPFSIETWMPYHLAQGAKVEITIYDAEGRSVRRLALGNQAAGYYVDRKKAAHWDGRDESGKPVGSGAYIYQLRAGDVTMTRRMEIVK